MSRRRIGAKREPVGDPKYGDILVSRFVNVIMKKGKKSLAERIFYSALDQVNEKMDDEPLEVFKRGVDNVKPPLEVKSRRVGGSTYQVPIEVKYDRQIALALRWIIANARKRGERGFHNRLAGEIMDAANRTGGAIKKREDTLKMAEANKAFAHYRW
ncbi:SSU ribosomal protein S7p (S5e) [hydrothermal vent metagenome]|uniref:SSU ribosomal protein S7p (S5e) n=1 Tax=hydrothermal vent metagenome TaxID=652676 RepID=A0A3B1CG21_9ZZZZ